MSDPIAFELNGDVFFPERHGHLTVKRSERGAVSSLWQWKSPPDGAVPLIRRDEARKVAEWLIAAAFWKANGAWYNAARIDAESAKVERDRWKAECEKAQVERDEIVEQVEQLGAEYRDIKAERDELREKLAHPDPLSPSRLRLAEETAWALGKKHASAGPGYYQVTPLKLKEMVAEAEAATAREQERDAEIGVMMRALHPDTITPYEEMSAARDALDAHRAERSEK